MSNGLLLQEEQQSPRSLWAVARPPEVTTGEARRRPEKADRKRRSRQREVDKGDPKKRSRKTEPTKERPADQGCRDRSASTPPSSCFPFLPPICSFLFFPSPFLTGGPRIQRGRRGGNSRSWKHRAPRGAGAHAPLRILGAPGPFAARGKRTAESKKASRQRRGDSRGSIWPRAQKEEKSIHVSDAER